MVYKECNLRAGVYKVQTFGTTQTQHPKSMSKSDTSATYLTRDSDLWILRLSATKCQQDVDKELSTTPLICDTKSSSLRVSPQEMVSTRPLATAKLTIND